MITASIVLYNTKNEQLDAVIKSYTAGSGRKLFLIDNSPERNLHAESYVGDSVEYIFNNANIGYGAAHNIGIKKAIEVGSAYHLVLNPDLRFEPEVIDQLKEYADRHADVVYMLPKVLYPNGEIQYLCKLLPTPADLIFRRFLPKTKSVVERNERYELRMFGYDKIINPPCLSGCFMFLRVDTLKEHDLSFDDRYFMYCEDFDLMRRLHKYGKTIFYPYVSIIHDHAHESYKNKKMLKLHIKSAIRYFNKFGWLRDPERNRWNKEILNEIAKLC